MAPTIAKNADRDEHGLEGATGPRERSRNDLAGLSHPPLTLVSRRSAGKDAVRRSLPKSGAAFGWQHGRARDARARLRAAGRLPEHAAVVAEERDLDDVRREGATAGEIEIVMGSTPLAVRWLQRTSVMAPAAPPMGVAR